MIRVCVDVNVWIAHYLTAVRRPGNAGAASGLARAVFDGACRVGPLQLVISHRMLDTLAIVMTRLPALMPYADMARDQVEAAAGRGYVREPPVVVLGGSGAYPLLDEDDAGVLNTAIAGPAVVLVTSNLADFVRGPRARTDTKFLTRDGDAVRLSHPKLPGGLLIASPARAAAWLLRGEDLPDGFPD